MYIGIDTIGLSSFLSNCFTIDSQNDGDVFSVGVDVNDKNIYLTTLYGVDCKAKFYDLGILVNEYMRDHNLTLANLKVHGYYNSGMETKEVWVVYSEFNISYELEDEFLMKHFLTTRSYYTIPRSQGIKVAFIVHTSFNEQTQGYLNACFKLADGSIHNIQLDVSVYDYQTTHEYGYWISASAIEHLLKSKYPNDSPHVLSGSLAFGLRHIDFYFVDEEPVETLIFSNAFNVWEYFFIFGSQTIKSDFDQKEALCSGRTTLYNQTQERKIEVETVPLSLEEADWLNQFFSSNCISKEITEYHDDRVILSDISSEISDSANEKVQLKFCWKYAEPKPWKLFDDEAQQFSIQYNDTFH